MIATLPLLTGCEKRCAGAVDPHASYAAAILDVYDAQSKFKFAQVSGVAVAYTDRCQSLDGMGPGKSIQVQASGQVSSPNEVCYLVSAQLVSAPAQLSRSGPSSDPYALLQAKNGNSFMYAVENATLGDCAGALVLGFYGGGNPGGIFAPPAEGGFPPALLYTLFLPSNGSCQPCDDLFVIQLTKE
ncbi:MAG TPA: hypothetical protein VF524_15945 [Polyangia bacterium]